jgi:carbon-monoxide dehydrogenase small subunit
LPKQQITLSVNGQTREIAVDPAWTLLETVREQLRLTGAKEGCGTGDCGACSMLLRGPQDERARLVTSCLVLAVQADGAEVTTIEGLATNGSLHPVQAAFVEKGGVQCGFCTPGMIMAAASLLERNPSPTLDEVREGLAGNLCRCTGYTKIYESVLAAADMSRGQGA